jgi:hypothetical protein
MREALGWLDEADDRDVAVGTIALEKVEVGGGGGGGAEERGSGSGNGSDNEGVRSPPGSPLTLNPILSVSATSALTGSKVKGEAGAEGCEASGRSPLSLMAIIEPFYVVLNPELRRPLVVLGLIQFSLSFGSFGISTWISTLFDDIGIKDVYLNSFLFSAACIPGNIFTIFYMDFFGYRRMLIWGMMSTSVAALAFAIDHKHPVAVVIFASLFNMCSIVAWNALDIACVDAVPVASRSSVYAVLSAGGRVGAISAQFVNASLEKSVGVLLFVTTSCMLLGGLVSYKVEGGDKLATPTDGVRGSM